jgi:hypothetical protein
MNNVRRGRRIPRRHLWPTRWQQKRWRGRRAVDVVDALPLPQLSANSNHNADVDATNSAEQSATINDDDDDADYYNNNEEGGVMASIFRQLAQKNSRTTPHLFPIQSLIILFNTSCPVAISPTRAIVTNDGSFYQNLIFISSISKSLFVQTITAHFYPPIHHRIAIPTKK